MSQPTKPTNYGALGTLVIVFFFWGFIAASNSILIPFCKTHFALTQFESQLLGSAFYVAYFVGCLILFVVSNAIGTDIVNKIGYKRGIIYGGYALWNYLYLPFLLASPDIEVKEIDSWEEGGIALRRLHTIFPDNMPTHCKEQIFYFDSDNLLFRHDYTAEVFGTWAKAAHYSSRHKDFEGLIVPVRRRVFPRKSSGYPLRLITLVSIDIDEVKLIGKSSQ